MSMNKTCPISNFTSEERSDGKGFVLPRNSGLNESISAQRSFAPALRTADRREDRRAADLPGGGTSSFCCLLRSHARALLWRDPFRPTTCKRERRRTPEPVRTSPFHSDAREVFAPRPFVHFGHNPGRAWTWNKDHGSARPLFEIPGSPL